MENKQKFEEIFRNVLGVEGDVTGLTRADISQWDSLAHISLVSEVEDSFDIFLDTDEILSLDSFVKGLEILKAHDIE